MNGFEVQTEQSPGCCVEKVKGPIYEVPVNGGIAWRYDQDC
jgi:hypothetical protein